MKKKHKLISLVLAVFMLSAYLTACAADTPTPPAPAPAPAPPCDFMTCTGTTLLYSTQGILISPSKVPNHIMKHQLKIKDIC